jgi:hypothetical protein
VRIETLAAYQRCVERVNSNWSAFLARRKQWLAQQERHGVAAERAAENILEDLFTGVLDWSLSDLNNQLDYADIVLTRFGIKQLVIEVKRPGALAWNRRAVEAALAQARRYAEEQRVRHLAVSDGLMFYAADITPGGLHDRVFVSLDAPEPPASLWWLSVQGIYRPREEAGDAVLRLLSDDPVATRLPVAEGIEAALLHPKYHLPADCFAYVGQASDPRTWKPPFCLVDGCVDGRRLPKAIQAILSNYRGLQVGGILEAAVPDVLVRLGQAAARLGKLPHQTHEAAEVYRQLAAALDQLGRLDEVTSG